MKNSNYVRILSFILVCLFVFPLFSSCGEIQKENKKSSDVPITNYTLVRGDSCDNDVLKQVLLLKDALERRFQKNITTSTDWAVDKESQNSADGKDRYEVLIGITNRAESVECNRLLENKYGYLIRTVNHKIVITATTQLLLARAITFFIANYITPSDNGGYLPEDIYILNTDFSVFTVSDSKRCTPVVLPEQMTEKGMDILHLFTSRLKELSSVEPQILKTSDIQNETNYLLILQDEKKAKACNLKKNEWTIYYKKDHLELVAPGDEALAAALSYLYDFIRAPEDRKLDGSPILYYGNSQTLFDDWNGFSPAVIGGRYLGTETISSSAGVTYYESVTTSAFEEYCLLLQKNSFGYQKTSLNDPYMKGSLAFYNPKTGSCIELQYSALTKNLAIMDRTL